MEIKILEVRDSMTFLSILAIKIEPDNPLQYYYTMRCGYRNNPAIMITQLDGERMASADPYSWKDRTFSIAHNHIILNWDDLKDGDVVDVEYILKETKKPKPSERFNNNIELGGF